MALRRPTLLFCIMTIVLGVSFDNFSSPFSGQRGVDIPRHLTKDSDGDQKTPRSEEQDSNLDGCLLCHVDNVEVSECPSECPEYKRTPQSPISEDVLLESMCSYINVTKHDSDLDGQQKQTGSPSVRLKGQMQSNIANFMIYAQLVSTTETQSIDDPNSTPPFEQERSELYLKMNDNKMTDFGVCDLTSAPQPNKSIDLTRFSMARPDGRTDHGQSDADLSKFKPDIDVIAFLDYARDFQPNGSTLHSSFRSNKSEGTNTSFSPKNTLTFNMSLVKLWKEGRRDTKRETSCKRERELTLLCVCLSLCLLRNEDLKQKLLAPLLDAITHTTSVKSLIKEALQRILALPEVKGVLAHHALGKDVSNNPVSDSKKDRLHSLPDEDVDFGRTPKFYPDGPPLYGGIPKAGDGRVTHDKFPGHADVSWLTSFTFLRPRTVSITWPASFLPSMGSSPHDNMSHLGCRLASLHSLPSSCDVSRVRLAQAGFYYDNSKTARDASNVHEVTCFSCGISYSQWKKGDNPEVIHQQLKHDCEHLINITTMLNDTNNNGSSISSSSMNLQSTSFTSSSGSSGYWSMNEESVRSTLPTVAETPDSLLQEPSLQSTTSSSQSGRVAMAGTHTQASLTGTHTSRHNNNGDLATDCAAIVPAPVTSSNQTTNQMPMPRTANVPSPNQSSSYGPRDLNSAYNPEERPPLLMQYAVYPQFSRLQEREATFASWPLTQYFPPKQLVMQGFYFAGYADCIRCFYCGVGLKSWAENDDVMTEHIRYRPSCGYILNTKGRPFVNSVLARIEGTENGQVTQTSSAVSRDASISSASTNTTATTSSSLTSSSASSPAASATADGNAGVGAEVLKTVTDMGFSQDHIARAVRMLQQSGEGSVNVDSLVEKLVEMTTDGESTSASGAASNDTERNHEIQTDGPGDSMASDADSERAHWLALENERLRSRHKCKTCFQEKVGMIFLPCGHIVACTGCGGKLRHCTKCGDYIRATANVYL